MYHPTTRVLTVLELLQSYPRISGPELSRRLEVDVRTVRRYVTMLQELGIPVETIRGRYGAYRLRPGFKLPPLMLTEDEALAVVLGLHAGRRMGLADAAPSTEGALAKIERVLPASVRERVRAVEENLIFDAAPESVPATNAVVVTVAGAIHQRGRVLLRYRAYLGEETERAVDPYGVVHRAGRWYLAGYCHLRHDVRTFRLDRVLAVETLAETFEPPAGFDCLRHVEEAIARTPGIWRVVAVLDAPLEHVRCRISPAYGTLTEEQGGVRLVAYVNDLDEAAHFLAGLGCPFTVIQPPELRDALNRLAAHVLRQTARQ